MGIRPDVRDTIVVIRISWTFQTTNGKVLTGPDKTKIDWLQHLTASSNLLRRRMWGSWSEAMTSFIADYRGVFELRVEDLCRV